MKRLLWIFLLVAGGLPLFAQTTPDCVIAFNLAAVAQRSSITTCGHNTQGVWEWRVIYANTGFTGPLSLRLESSQDGVTWVTFAGTIQDGINPNTSILKGSTDMFGFNPYVSVVLNAAAGSGNVQGVLYGCRQPGCSEAGATVTATIPTPVPVDGPTAAGAAPTTPPVLIAGQDGAPGAIRTIKTDALGELIPSNASVADGDALSNTQLSPTGAAGGTLFVRVFEHVFDGTNWNRMVGNTTGVSPSNAPIANADGQSNTQPTPTDVAGNPLMMRVIPYEFDGTNLNRSSSCPHSLPFTVSGTDVRIVTGIAMTTIKICQVAGSWLTAADVTIREGTGVTCGTGTATMAGPFANLVVMGLDPKSDGGSYDTATTGDDACLHFSVSTTGGGVVLYAQ